MILLNLVYANAVIYEVLAFDKTRDELRLRHLVTGEITERSRAELKQVGYVPISLEEWQKLPASQSAYFVDCLEKYIARHIRGEPLCPVHPITSAITSRSERHP